MSPTEDRSEELRARVGAAYQEGTPLRIRGGGTKDFYGRCLRGALLETGGHQGIVDYEPTELFVTVRSGTLLRELEALLAESQQMLPFEPPHFGPLSTVGGMVAAGLGGPRRPYSGSVRDAVLGLHCVNGKGEVLKVGGQVVKNVAGYDVSRLMCGAMGTLGLLLQVSLKVLPVAPEFSLVRSGVSLEEGLKQMHRWAGQGAPLSAAAYTEGRLHARFIGRPEEASSSTGDIQPGTEAQDFWQALRDQRLPFFSGAGQLWRISLAPASPPLPLSGEWLIDWGGAQRWLRSESHAAEVRAVCAAAGAHATLFRAALGDNPDFQHLEPGVLALHKRLKRAFDPGQILNRGRLFYEGDSAADGAKCG